MMGEQCDEMRLLIQADIDGEVPAAEAAHVAAHVAGCPDCAASQARLLALSARLREHATYHAAPAALRTAVLSRIDALAPSVESAPASPTRVRRSGWTRLRSLLPAGAPFGAGFALAACLALLLILPGRGELPESVVASHIRALQPGHLMDVPSTDQHTVKPWFDGRLDFAPPVKDLAASGFPLAGGRLDYLFGRPVAALVYQRRQHIIELFAWPDGGHFDHGPAEGSRSGYNFVHWNRDGMAFWAVSDLSPQELAEFVRLWQAV